MDQSAQLYWEVHRFLYTEARLLDRGLFRDWLELMADDVDYKMPVRLTRERGAGDDTSTDMWHFYEDRQTLQKRIDRLYTDFAWAEDPPSRTRHHVTNIQINPGDNEDEVEVISYFLIYRNRGDTTEVDLLSGERQDVLRKVDGAWKLAKRYILIDQASLGTKNLAIFI